MTHLEPEDAEAAAVAPAPPLPCDPELRAVLDEFIQSRKTANTREAYRFALVCFLRTVRISSLVEFMAVMPADVVQFRNELQKRKRAPSTVNQHLAAVRGVYRRLLRLKKIERNPADPELVEGLRVSRESRSEALTFDEVKKVLYTCDGTLRGLRDRALIITLYYEGLRRSEASKLNWRDLTTRRGLLEVRDAKNNPYATIRLRREAREAIDAYTEVLNRELRRRAPGPKDPVFVSLSPIRSYGRRLAANSINKIVKERVRMAGIERRVTAHGFRHTCATHSLAHGVPLHQVQSHLRHSDPRTTMRYNHDRDVRSNPTTEALPSISLE
jgi:site-specific recombinase XerD